MNTLCVEAIDLRVALEQVMDTDLFTGHECSVF